MLWINVALSIWIVSNSIRSQVEKTVVWIEHSPRQLNKEISCKSASILPSFSSKVNVKIPLELQGILMVKLGICVSKYVSSLNYKTKTLSSSFSSHLVKFLFEMNSFVLKIEDVWHIQYKVVKVQTLFLNRCFDRD